MKSPTSLSTLNKDSVRGMIAILVVAGCAVGWGEFRRSELQTQITSETQQYRDSLVSLASTTADSRLLVSELQSKLESVMNESVALSGAIKNEQGKNDAIQEQVGKVSSTVGALDKLSKTDPELLEKYSKIYFLNEHYTPSGLSTVSSEFAFDKSVKYQIHTGIATKLDAMLRAASADGSNLLVASAYRSFGTQAALKSSYKVTYGTTKANQFSADQGYSEHQLGTTLDFTTIKTGAVLEGFDDTKEFSWLVNNAYKYGFVMSYPKGNAYYIYEPWHWRYVGVDLAERLHRENKNFYDMDQRVINDYLLLIFN